MSNTSFSRREGVVGHIYALGEIGKGEAEGLGSGKWSGLDPLRVWCALKYHLRTSPAVRRELSPQNNSDKTFLQRSEISIKHF